MVAVGGQTMRMAILLLPFLLPAADDVGEHPVVVVGHSHMGQYRYVGQYYKQ